jgi:hypothetical protein
MTVLLGLLGSILRKRMAGPMCCPKAPHHGIVESYRAPASDSIPHFLFKCYVIENFISRFSR